MAGESCVMKSFMNDQIKNREIVRTYSTHEEVQECIQGIDGKSRKKPLENLDVVGRIILQ